MTTLSTPGAQVASNNSSEYKSIAPSILFGIFGAFFQARNARKRGLTDTRRYWKAAWISTGVSFIVGIILMILMVVVFASALSSVNSGVSTSEPPISRPAVTTPEQPPVVPAVQIGPKADVTPKDMAMQLATIRHDAFCKGGTTGVNLLNQVWAYQGAPAPLSYKLQDAANPDALAPTEPHSTYSTDLEQLKNFDISGTAGEGCNHAPVADDLQVTEAYELDTGLRVVASTFVSRGHLYDGYTAVYVLKDGRWYIDQMH